MLIKFIQHPDNLGEGWGYSKLVLFSVILCYYKGYICYSIYCILERTLFLIKFLKCFQLRPVEWEV